MLCIQFFKSIIVIFTFKNFLFNFDFFYSVCNFLRKYIILMKEAMCFDISLKIGKIILVLYVLILDSFYYYVRFDLIHGSYYFSYSLFDE